MSKKSPNVPPPRPSAPKGIVGGGMSYSFKALEEEMEDDLALVKCNDVVIEEPKRETGETDTKSEVVVSKTSHTTDTLSIDSKQRKEMDIEKLPGTKSTAFERLLDLKGKVSETLNKKKDELLSSDLGISVREKLLSQPLAGRQGVVAEKEKTQNTQTKTAGASFRQGDDSISLQNVMTITTVSNEPITDKPDINTELYSINNGLAAEVEKEDVSVPDTYFYCSEGDSSGINQTVRQRKLGENVVKPVKPPAPVFKSIQKAGQELPTTASPRTTGIVESNINNSVKMDSFQFHVAKVPVKKLVCVIIFVFLYMIIPFPSYINGMIVGAMLTSLAWLLYIRIMEPTKLKKPFPEEPSLDKPPPLISPEMKEPRGEDCSYKGWMNEIMDYNLDTYSINLTHSVYVHLNGTMLRLRRPKVNIPKRAMWDEPTPSPQFIHQRHFDVLGSNIQLLPDGLVKKRLWSKKYPICIELANDGKKSIVKQESLGHLSPNGNQSPCKIRASNSSDSVLGFELVNENKCNSPQLFLFARTCQEKEQWFKRLSAAALGRPLKNHILEIKRILNNSSMCRHSSSNENLQHKRQGSSDSLSSVRSSSSNMEEIQSAENDLKNFVTYISRFIPKDTSSPSSPAHSGTFKEKDTKGSDKSVTASGTGHIGIVCDPALLPLNALLGRCFWDFFSDQNWANTIKSKLQNKLSKIHIPYFIEELKVSKINLGTEIPVIRHTNKPYLDENGFWVDLDITYSGRFKMTIETKVNLLRLTQNVTSRSTEEKKVISAVINSDEEDSAESSTDEEEESSACDEEGAGASGGTGRKIMKYINKITASKYFQSATENKYIKKAMTEVSNTPLVLTVEMQKLSGTLAINIPPPPTDRLWYGFRGNPSLWLVAKPKVGEREVTVSHITEWIEKKLAVEFQHVLVMPNMDDIVIPIMTAGSMVDICTALSDSSDDVC